MSDFIIITSVSCKKDGDNVILDPEADSGDKAVFLMNPKDRGDGKYVAVEVNHTKAAEIIKKNTSDSKIPLFCVHGFSNEPSDIINSILRYRKKFDSSKYFPVFVIWPCSGFLNWDKGTVIGYDKDADVHSQASGRAFFDFVNKIPDETFPRKSLMMHSMGNHVVFDGACLKGVPGVQFENIFMVAADVPHDGFHKDPAEGYWSSGNKKIWGNKNKKANNFYEMLAKGTNGRPKGKIVVLHNGSDKALAYSSWVANNERRLGQRGMGTYRSNWNLPGGIYYLPNYYLIDKFKDCHANEDCNSWASTFPGHGYHFNKKAVAIYDKYAI